MVRVKLYGILAYAAGDREVSVDASGCKTVRCVLERLAEERPGLANALRALEWDLVVIIDGKPGSVDAPPGDVIALFPPASGGSLRIKAVVLRSGESVSVDEAISWLSSASESVGAIAVFTGVVRGVNKGERVEYLDYDYDSDRLEKELERIAGEVASKYGLAGAFVAHYVGRRVPGEITLVVAVAGSHRHDVYPALDELVHRVKHEAPIWKTEARGGRLIFMVGDREISEDEISG